MKRRVVLFSLLVIVSTSGQAQRYSAVEREILRLQDQRSTGDGKLFAYLKSKNVDIRTRALFALANIQDTSTSAYVHPLLKDPVAKVRAVAAFAVGQIGSRESQPFLLDQLHRERDSVALQRIIEAVGKFGDQSAISDLDTLKLSPKLRSLYGETALSVARYALRGIKSETGMLICLRLMNDANPSVRWKALYGLWRMMPYERLDKALEERESEVKKLAADKSSEVRMHLATFLGRSKATLSYTILRELARHEKSTRDWRVQVQLVRSLALWISLNPTALDELLPWLDSQNTHVKIAALVGVSNVSKDHVEKAKGKEQFRLKLHALITRGKQDDLVRGEAVVAVGKFFPSDFTFADLLHERKTSVRFRSKVLEGMSYIPTTENLSLIVSYVEDEDVKLAVSAWESLRRILSAENIKRMRKEESLSFLPDLLYRRVKSSLLRDDMAITTLASQAAGDSSTYSILAEGGRAAQIVEELMLTYTRLSSPNDTEAMQAILETLGKIGDEKVRPVLERALLDPDRTVARAAAASLKRITGEDYSGSLLKTTEPVYKDYDWRTLEGIAVNQRVHVRTERGTFTVQLFKEHAPFSVLSFTKLVKKELYKGLTFHRVVPNFVIQGGDPRGDGWGGPGYSIRSEWSTVNYERGSVGLASAGKDTEGCQFFVTHSPQPHLDGRYTIVGRVVQGMDVVDKIQIGDKITAIQFVK